MKAAMIRKAEKKDISKILELLQEVLEVHAALRPDMFVSGTTKYSESDIEEILRDETKPVYVAVDENDEVMGYAFCIIKDRGGSDFLVKYKYIYIDDLCVGEEFRGRHIGKQLFEYVKEEAEKLGCYELLLNVWEENENALKFYEKIGMKTKERHMEYIL